MKTNILKAFLGMLLVSLYTGCGSDGSQTTDTSSTGSSGSVSISGDVAAPASASISVAESLSKSVSTSKGVVTSQSAPSRITVSKAVTDSAVTSGTVKAKLLDGTVLDTGIINSAGKISGLVVDSSRLDSTKQVLIEATDRSGRKFTNLADLTGKVAGDIVDSGTTDSDTTLSVQQVYYQSDASSSPDNPSAIAAKLASGDIKPLALFKTFKNVFSVTSSAGSSDAASAYQSLSKAFKAAMASGSPPKFSDINSALQGGSILNTWQGFDSSLSGVDMSTAIGQIQNYIPAVANTFKDSATYTKYAQAGDTGWQSCAQYFGKQTSTELKNGADKPEVFRGYLSQNADAFNGGDATAFDAMKKAGVARVIGQFAGNMGSGDSFSAGQFASLRKLIDGQSASFDTLSATKFAAMGEAFYNQIKAADSASEQALINADPKAFGGKMFDNPGAYSGAAGATAFNNQFITYVQNPTSFITASGCSSSSDCSGGQICSPYKFCMASCSSNCGVGSACTSNGQCSQGTCNTSAGVCEISASFTGNPLAAALKANGSSCTAGNECGSGTCSSGSCVAPVISGQAAYAGTYKKTTGQTPTCNINLQIDAPPSAGTFISVQPVNISSPNDNTFYMGGQVFTVSGNTFSVSSGSIMKSGAVGTIRCDGTAGSTVLTLSNGRLTGTCVLTTTSGTSFPASCTIDHTKL